MGNLQIIDQKKMELFHIVDLPEAAADAAVVGDYIYVATVEAIYLVDPKTGSIENKIEVPVNGQIASIVPDKDQRKFISFGKKMNLRGYITEIPIPGR